MPRIFSAFLGQLLVAIMLRIFFQLFFQLYMILAVTGVLRGNTIYSIFFHKSIMDHVSLSFYYSLLIYLKYTKTF